MNRNQIRNKWEWEEMGVSASFTLTSSLYRLATKLVATGWSHERLDGKGMLD